MAQQRSTRREGAIARAKKLAERYEIREVHPDSYIPRGAEQDEWDRLLGGLDDGDQGGS